ncbi:MBL fold metallo-hydrolase [Pseudoalteromonas sp. J010]|uniref:Metallo-beta-lactamase domain-containing protein n=1 Tax=Pseudoalteromonas peptidolytica F12-50-A1 TaxID=1315280 RepID=A0A8I0MZF6_9GAMM|nr:MULTISPECIES: MBL fold metallo-hydrolase [Pseudoalteromonas]MBE0347950.1 hypothetical protein [Pseudoalteromonas peptidolytica F12-50-A1]MDW7551067.1 MBL fold metallo-hydrolase [Pseudoalteromonas peptidolytica]NLR16375.1 MBL fold metallo-hydrolase [Pseudoalteromonas peptidolytica]RRS07363.1 MBL fold metallo-hydrolase [Pseudoalteromonas sp. J010]USD28589.1 MBL fold metallo-hydrolase [Pseudoalteromonas sp. SCSIO 43201]
MKIHTLEGYIQHIYLVEHGSELLLLDGCCRADVDVVCHFIQQLQKPLSALKLIVVTHMHPDHAGGAHKLRKLTGAKIATANAPSQWYRGIDGVMMHLSDMALALWVAGRKRKAKRNLWYPRRLAPDFFLADGDKLPYFEQWQAIHTPGHTDRDISLLHQPSGRMYVADLTVKVKGQFVAPFPVFYPRLYRLSLAKVKALQPHSLILAHQGEVPASDIDFDALIANAPKQPMTHWRSVKKKTKRALGLGR